MLLIWRLSVDPQLVLTGGTSSFDGTALGSAETNSNFYYSNSCEQNDQILLLKKY